MTKTAIVLFNLGGPDNLAAVKPFLFNLFNDAAIITLPKPLRFLIAKLISSRRAKIAAEIYQKMGGKSPILQETEAQAAALEQALKTKGAGDYKVFISMRYWNPRSDQTVRDVKAYEPDHIVLLPLYPHYSTTTTASSFSDWQQAAQKAQLHVQTSKLCCYPADLHFIAAHARLVREAYWKAADEGKPRILFSAHGLPEKVIAKGDPYQWQIEKTVASIRQILAIDDLDYEICYQSRVGPVQWIGPFTDEEIIHAGKDKVPLVVVPVAFVSEHSETLVELDIDYKKLADDNGVPLYIRVPALGVDSLFIDGLADLCVAMPKNESVCSFEKKRYCPRRFTACPCAA